jgi:hypothetical protein
VRVPAGGRGAVVAGRRRIRDGPGHVGGFRFPALLPPADRTDETVCLRFSNYLYCCAAF